jgi:hypothetical protein
MAENINIDRVEAIGQPFFGYQWLMQINNVSADPVSGLQDVSLRATSASVPSVTTQTAEKNWMNHTIVYPTKPEKHGTITLSIDMYSDLAVRQLFEDWRNAIVDTDTGVGYSFSEITGRVVLKLLNANPQGGGEEAQEIGRAILFMCWPQEVGEVPLEQGNQEQGSFDVTMQYSNFRMISG